jgi:hypothetical protein
LVIASSGDPDVAAVSSAELAAVGAEQFDPVGLRPSQQLIRQLSIHQRRPIGRVCCTDR